MFDIVALLFVVAAVFGYINYRLIKLPFAVGMMVSALASSLVVLGFDAAFPALGAAEAVRDWLRQIDFAEALMHGMLSFLLFAGALHVDFSRLRKWLVPILTLASIGVLLSTALIGAGVYFLFQALGSPVELIWCLLFGALISPTDPVAVLGIMKAAGAPKDVEIKVIGESLFNDGVGVVVFSVLLSLAGPDSSLDLGLGVLLGDIGLLLLKEVVGGIGLGAIGGFLATKALRRMDEANLETLISVSMVMGLTWICFRLHASAPLACVVAGLIVGNRTRAVAMSDTTRMHVDIVWGFVDEALNAILFLLVGLEVLVLGWKGYYVLACLAAVALTLLARLIAVIGPMTVLGLRTEFRKGTRRILTWGGIKGGISIALALSLPSFEGREIVLAMTYVVVVFSILTQGLTIGRLIQRVIPTEDRDADEEGAH